MIDALGGMLLLAVVIVATLAILFWGIIIPCWNRDIARHKAAEHDCLVLMKDIDRLKKEHNKLVAQNFQMRLGYQRAHWRAFATNLEIILWVREQQGDGALVRFAEAIAKVIRPSWTIPPWLLDEHWTPPDEVKEAQE